MNFFNKLLVIIFISFSSGFSQEILINNRDAAVWATNQNITGKLVNFYSPEVSLNINGHISEHSVVPSDSSFSIDITIDNGLSNITIESGSIKSDTLKYTLGFKILPEIYVYAAVSGRNVSLHTSVIENPKSEELYFIWEEDFQKNPQLIDMVYTDSTAEASFPENAKHGEYYFNLLAIILNEDTIRARTFVTVDSTGIKPFDIKNDYAAWIDSAIIYQITPYNFVNNGKFIHITQKIPELAEFGVTTIYLQPVYATHNRGQGYDITNYFAVRSDLGTEEELKELIKTAKTYGLKVIFDFVANHSSLYHPYAEDSKTYGGNSHYYNFYQREEDTAPYSQHYQHYQGFINYFWDELPNLNYSNPEVDRWITEAAKYWIKNFDIDGYRFDAVWGVNARDPEFAKNLRLALKRIKPEILMLAEDKATHPEVFNERFDAAYDWAPEISWVSHWVWQYDYDPNSNPTIFNSGSVNNRSTLLRNSLNNNGNGYAPDAKILRFLENNDLFHFITHHSLEQTKMAAALLFSLHGIPMLYNGQEVGREGHPYEINSHFFMSNSIESRDRNGLFPYYKRLIELRKFLPSLNSDNFEEISVSPGSYIFAYRRWTNNQNVFGVINMSGNQTTAEITFPFDEINVDSSQKYYLTDMISGEVISGNIEELQETNISINGYTTRIFLFADTMMTITDVRSIADNISPAEFKLEQNYPNPFNPSTKIKFSIPIVETGHAPSIQLKVYDILGREVAILLDEVKQPGNYEYEFNSNTVAGGLPSGVYFYRLEYNNISLTKKMMLLK